MPDELVGNEGVAPNTCPLCDYEGMMPWCRDQGGVYGKCPSCGCEFEEDREEGETTRRDDERVLAAWTAGTEGW